MDWTNRYRHVLTRCYRVWPMNPRTTKAGLEKTEFEIDGMTFTHNARLAVTSRYGKGKPEFYVWELEKAEGDELSSAGAADAKILDMRVKTPGTLLDDVKKECWLEVRYLVYPKGLPMPAWSREIMPTGVESDVRPRIEAIWQRDFEHAAKAMRIRYQYEKPMYEAWLEENAANKRTFKGIHYVMHKEMVDIPLLARKIREGYVVLIDMRLKLFGRVEIKKVQAQLDYYVEEGRAADEEGGLFKGYCLGHSVFWCRELNLPSETLAAGEAAVAEYKANARRERRRSKVRAHVIKAVTTRVAEYYGVSRELTMRRFLEVGFDEWLADVADKAALDESRMHLCGMEAQVKNHVGEAAKVLAFCIDATATRPPDPPPKILTSKQQEAKAEYQRKKLDAFNKMTPEEQAKARAKAERRRKATPAGMLEDIIAAYAKEQHIDDLDTLTADLTYHGITDLILNAIRVKRERNAGKLQKPARDYLLRLGPQAIGVFRKCKTGEIVASWHEGEIVR